MLCKNASLRARASLLIRTLQKLLLIGAALFVAGCSVSNSLSWFMTVPTVSPATLRKLLASSDGPVIFDLRKEDDFARGHIAFAESVSNNNVGGRARPIAKSREIVLVCYHGNLAALLGPVVRGAGHEKVVVLEGGMERWLAEGGAITQERTKVSEKPPSSRLYPTKFAAVLTYGAGVVIKPMYMLMALGLIGWLRRTEARDLKRLRMGLIVFLSGEAACLAGFYLDAKSVLFHGLDVLHGLGMALGIAYGLWGVYEIAERRLLSMNELHHGCALSRFCGTCTRRPDTLCRPQQQLRHGIWLLVPIVAFPWSQVLVVREGSTLLFGTLVDYGWPIINQFIELRVYPCIAMIALLAAWYLMRGPRSHLDAAHRCLFLGLGLLCFSMLRVLLKSTFAEEPYWSDIWEEVTELQGIASVLFVMWIFRKRFGLEANRQA